MAPRFLPLARAPEAARETADDCLCYLSLLQPYARAAAEKLGITIDKTTALNSRVAIVDLWHNLESQHIHFFDYKPTADEVSYTFKRSTRELATYSPRLTAAARRYFAPKPRAAPPILKFSPTRWKQHIDFDDPGPTIDKIAHWLQLFAAERNFLQKLDISRDVMHGRRLALRSGFRLNTRTTINPQSFHKASVIVTVSALEAFLKDAMLAFNHLWLEHLAHENQLAGAQKLATDLRIMDKLTLELGQPRNWNAKDVLESILRRLQSDAPESRSMANWQNLTEDRGAKWAYRHFLDIRVNQLPEMLSWNQNYWNDLTSLFKLRNTLVHGDATKKVGYAETVEFGDLVTRFENEVLRALRKRAQADPNALL